VYARLRLANRYRAIDASHRERCYEVGDDAECFNIYKSVQDVLKPGEQYLSRWIHTLWPNELALAILRRLAGRPAFSEPLDDPNVVFLRQCEAHVAEPPTSTLRRHARAWYAPHTGNELRSLGTSLTLGHIFAGNCLPATYPMIAGLGVLMSAQVGCGLLKFWTQQHGKRSVGNWKV